MRERPRVPLPELTTLLPRGLNRGTFLQFLGHLLFPSLSMHSDPLAKAMVRGLTLWKGFLVILGQGFKGVVCKGKGREVHRKAW